MIQFVVHAVECRHLMNDRITISAEGHYALCHACPVSRLHWKSFGWQIAKE